VFVVHQLTAAVSGLVKVLSWATVVADGFVTCLAAVAASPPGPTGGTVMTWGRKAPWLLRATSVAHVLHLLPAAAGYRRTLEGGRKKHVRFSDRAVHGPLGTKTDGGIHRGVCLSV
jgi:hypothetical protein